MKVSFFWLLGLIVLTAGCIGTDDTDDSGAKVTQVPEGQDSIQQESGIEDILDVGQFVYPKHEKQTIAIFIDENTYSELSVEIERFRQDITEDLSTTQKTVEVKIYHNDYSSPSEIKSIIQNQYKDSNLIGVILVGDVPIKYFRLPILGAELREWAPSDWYYMDVEGTCVEEINETHAEIVDPFYENSPCPQYPRIWVGRIKPPVGGEAGLELLKKYFDRNHDYRSGRLNYNDNIAFYIAFSDESVQSIDKQHYFDNELKAKIGTDELYPGLSINDLILGYGESYKEQYLSKLQTPYQYTYYTGHGNYFNAEYELTSDTIENTKPQGMFYKLATCGNGPFDLENYIGGRYLFDGNALLVDANVEPVIGSTTPETSVLMDEIALLKSGVSYGESKLILPSSSTPGLGPRKTLLGDPTLQFVSDKLQTGAEIRLNVDAIDFGEVSIGTSTSTSITIYNTGESPLYFATSYYNRVLGTNDLIGADFSGLESYRTSSRSVYLWQVLPKTSGVVSLSFNPRTAGDNEYLFYIISNSEETPLIKIPVYGKGIWEI